MLNINRLAVLSALLLTVNAVASPALDGPAPTSGIWARNPLLALRANIVYCGSTGGTTYCTDSVCCGLINCMPADAQCCTNGQYCLSGTTCVLDGSTMKCQDNSGSSSNPGSTDTKSGAGRMTAGGAGAALAVVGAIGMML